MGASAQFIAVTQPFDWAEPLICEQVIQTYGGRTASDGEPHHDRIAAAHTKMWLALIAGDGARFTALRADLARLAAELRFPAGEIERADRAVLLELVLVVVTRFRNSDRVRIGYIERLQAALRVIKANPSYTLH